MEESQINWFLQPIFQVNPQHTQHWLLKLTQRVFLLDTNWSASTKTLRDMRISTYPIDLLQVGLVEALNGPYAPHNPGPTVTLTSESHSMEQV